jgi:hypothetical protein
VNGKENYLRQYQCISAPLKWTGRKSGVAAPSAFSCAKRSAQSVCLAEPSLPSAPSGGRPREADTRPCLVMSPEASPLPIKRHACAVSLKSWISAAGGATRMGGNRISGFRRAAPLGRTIAPGRGHLRPRAAHAYAGRSECMADQQRSVSGTQHSLSS